MPDAHLPPLFPNGRTKNPKLLGKKTTETKAQVAAQEPTEEEEESTTQRKCDDGGV